jgi:hypothetical protein
VTQPWSSFPWNGIRNRSPRHSTEKRILAAVRSAFGWRGGRSGGCGRSPWGAGAVGSDGETHRARDFEGDGLAVENHFRRVQPPGRQLRLASRDGPDRLRPASPAQLCWRGQPSRRFPPGGGLQRRIRDSFQHHHQSRQQPDTVANDRPAGVTRNTGKRAGIAATRCACGQSVPGVRPVNRDRRSRNFELRVDAFNVMNYPNYPKILSG